MPTPEEQAVAVKEALYAGNKIRAIKLYRVQTGMGLAESKNALEKLEAELRTATPDLFGKPQATGCSATVLAIFVGGAVIYSLLA